MKKTSIIFMLFVLLFSFSCTDDGSGTDEENGTGLIFNSEADLENVDEADIDEDNGVAPAGTFTLTGPPILDQGETSKCVAFSAGYYITSMYNGVTSADNNKAGSPEYLYGQYKAINKDNECNEGCMLFNTTDGITGAAEILKQYGTTSWNQLPFQEANACAIINASLTGQAANNKIKDYYRLNKKESTNVEELKSWIYAGFPLFLGVNVDDAFNDLKAGGIINKKSGKGSGHAMVCVGYDDNKKAFKLANSWGTDWADNGYGWIDYDFLAKLLGEDGAEIGILVPNNAQRVNMQKQSPGSCTNANWGDVLINNNSKKEIAIEMTGANGYNNTDADNIDASESEFFTKMPKGALKVKVFSADKATVIKEYTVTVESCKEVVIDVN